MISRCQFLRPSLEQCINDEWLKDVFAEEYNNIVRFTNQKFEFIKIATLDNMLGDIINLNFQ